MNPRFFLRRHPQESRENVEKSEISEPKNETFQEKLTLGILKTFARNGAVTGLQPDEKRGQRKSVPFVNGGKANYEQTASSHRRLKISITPRSCVVVDERDNDPHLSNSGY
jgi:hypothetical protein